MYLILESFLQTLCPFLTQLKWVVKLWINEWKINQAWGKCGGSQETFPALLGQPNISKDAYSAYIQVEWISLLQCKTSSSFKTIK